MGDGMGAFERGYDAFDPGKQFEGLQRLVVGHAHVLRAAGVLQVAVLGSHAGIVESRGDGMGHLDLAVRVLSGITHGAVQHTRGAQAQRRRVHVRIQPVSRAFHADQANAVVEEGMEEPDGVAAAPHAGDEHVGETAFFLHDLLPRFPADDRLEITHQHGEGMGPCHRPDDVMGMADVGRPVAQGLVQRVLQRAAARVDGDDPAAHEAHAEDVQRLAGHVLGTHVDVAFQAEAGGHGGRGHAVLARPGLRDDPRFLHAPGEQDLADRVVDLVGARVVQVLPLEIDPRAAEGLRQPLRVVEGGRTAHVVPEVVTELLFEFRVPFRRLVDFEQLVQGRHQRLRNVAAAEYPKMSALVGQRGRRHPSLPFPRWSIRASRPSR